MRSEKEKEIDYSPRGNIYLEWQYEKDFAELYTTYEPGDGESVENWL